MAVIDKQVQGGNGINYTKEVTNSGDYGSLANNTYFKDLSTGLIYWKDTTGFVQDIFNKRYKFSITYNEITEVKQLFEVATNITAITLSNVTTLSYSLNGGLFNAVSLPGDLPIIFAANSVVIWKIIYTTGTTAVINFKATEL